MDCRCPPRLKLLFVFLLVSANSVCLHGTPVTGVDHHLHCATDYLYTINCSLSIATSENYSDSNSSYWLTFIETEIETETETDEKKKLVCTLTNTDEDYFCSLSTSSPDEDSGTFMDFDCFEISLCHSQNDGPENCEQLVDKYLPMTNITPNAPCQLTVSPDSGQHHFTWISTYEEYEDYTGLVEDLKFQLHYYKRGDTRLLSHEINTNSLNYSVDDQNFEPDTKYAARVRSSPHQAYYQGQWSAWSSEVHWGTESAGNEFPSNTFVSGRGKVLIPLCVLVPFLLLLLCYAPVKKWRQSAFIPTPAPYFHTLYSDFQGDFKSWVVTQENTADMLKAEETLQIDTLTECEVVEEEEESQLQFHHQLMEVGMYSNIADPGCDTSLLGIPYTVITMVPPSSAGSSHQSLTLSSQLGSPAQRDSGCWMEKDLRRYCNEYCTVSAFQQSGPVTAEDPGSSSTKSCSCPTGLIRMEAITEA